MSLREGAPTPIPTGDLELQRILKQVPELDDEPGFVVDNDYPWSLKPPAFEIARSARARRQSRIGGRK